MANICNNELEVKRHIFGVRLATELNVLAAVVFQTLVFWVQHNENTNVNYYDGYNWTYLSLNEFANKMFPYASKMQIRTALSNLEAADYILSRTDEEKQEHPKYYTITNKGRIHYNATEGTDKEYHSFNVSFACEYGITAAVLFENIYRWIQHNQMADEHYKDGMYWTYSTKKSMLDYFPYISKPTMQKHLQFLEDAEVLISERVETFSTKGSWYSITHKGFSIYNGLDFDESKEITHESKEITHESKKITHESKKITHESKKITLKDKSIKDIFNKDISITDTDLSSNLTANEDLRMVMPLNNRIVGMCRKALNRDFSYSEKQIVIDLIENQTPIEVLKLAIRDNEFRGAALSVAHIDASIKAWADAGCTTPTDIERFILVNHSHNIEKKFGRLSSITMKTKPVVTREAVKDIENSYNNQRYQEMRSWYDAAIKAELDIDRYLDERVKEAIRTVPKTVIDESAADAIWLKFVKWRLCSLFEAGNYDRLREQYISFCDSPTGREVNIDNYISEEVLAVVKAV